MASSTTLLQSLLTQAAVEYLRAENRMLRARFEGRRVIFGDTRMLAVR
jgi:hypothetical protein